MDIELLLEAQGAVEIKRRGDAWEAVLAIGRVDAQPGFTPERVLAAIDGRRVDVLTEGDFVPAGTAVTVTRVEGARIFVRSVAVVREEGT